MLCSEGARNFLMAHGKMVLHHMSVTSISSHSFKARGLKFGRNNFYMYGSKFVDQILEILPQSWDILVQRYECAL